MNKNVFSACYYPTTIFLIDNDNNFLENFSASLSLYFLTDYSSNVFKSLKIIQENDSKHSKDLSSLHNKLFSKNDDLIAESHYLSNLSSVSKYIRENIRFNQISTVIVDYSMPSMDGIEFCRELKYLPIKKIMLTGIADQELAINAFNEGIIDGFIQKDSKDMFNKICNLIDKLAKEYFQKVNKVVPNLLLSQSKNKYQEYIKIISDIINFHKVKEYYQFDEKGSFIFFSEKSQAICFIIIEKKQIDEYYEIALHSGAEFSVISAIKKYQKIPLLINEEDHRKSVLEWDNLLQPLKKFKSISDFYYLLINGKQINQLNL